MQPALAGADRIAPVVKGLQWVSMERVLKETFFPHCNSSPLNFEQPRIYE